MSDELVYADLAFLHTHPGHLAAVAALCGLPPPPVYGCRVLELACGTGFNLLAMSRSLPGGRFVGVDLSAANVRHGQRTAAAAGIDAVELRAGRLEDVDASFGQFDYVIAHGIFSWTTPETQRALLRVMRDRLTPTGLGYVSYNTHPGWGFRRALRDAMLLFDAPTAAPAERVRRAKEAVGRFIETLPVKDTLYHKVLQDEFTGIANDSVPYILAEHLAAENRPLLFTEFAAMLAAADLQYVAESRFATSGFAQTGDDLAALDAVGDDLIRREQLHDLRWQRYFRQSVVCPAGRAVPRAPDPEAMKHLWLTPEVEWVEAAGELTDAKADTVRRPADGTTWPVADTMLRRFVRRLHRAQGRPLPAAAFVPDARDAVPLPVTDAQYLDLIAQVIPWGVRDDLWHVSAAAPQFAADPGDRPRACPLARHQATAGPAVTNRLHRTGTLDEPDRELLVRLDGQATRDELAAALGTDRADVDARLARLATAAVLEE